MRANTSIPGPYPGPQPGPYPGPQPGPYPGPQPGPYPGPQPGPYPGPQPYPGEDPRIYEMARRSFDEVDTNHSQTIDIGEVSRALTKFAFYYGSEPPKGYEVIDSFQFMDKNHDGQVVFEEYLRYIKEVYFCGLGQPYNLIHAINHL